MPYELYFFKNEPLFNHENLTKFKLFSDRKLYDFNGGKITALVFPRDENREDYIVTVCKSVEREFDSIVLSEFYKRKTVFYSDLCSELNL